MARVVRDSRLDSRTARSRLPVAEKPVWRTINEGAHLGYRRNAGVGKWVARYRGAAGRYMQAVLGEADDVTDADGSRILDYRQAQDAARVWFAAKAIGDQPAPASYTVSDALDDYLNAHAGKSLEKTKARVERVVRPALGAIEVANLSKRDIDEWHQERGRSARGARTGRVPPKRKVEPPTTADALRRRRSTANRDLTVLKAALNKAFADGRAESDHAWRRVKPFAKVDAAKLRYLADDEARRLVNACDPVFRPMVVASLLTGGRYGELTAISTADVDLAAGVVMLRDTKSGDPRAVALGDEGRELFRQAVAGKASGALVFPRPDGGRWGPSQQARYMEAACIAGKVERATFHDLRRSFGARLARKGVPMAFIAEALGHKDERITRKHYAHLAPSHVADAVRAAIAGLGIVPPGNVVSIGA